MAIDVETVALKFPAVENVKVEGKKNAITGQHVEIKVEKINDIKFDIRKFKKFLSDNLPSHMVPQKIIFTEIEINSRFKKK